MDTNFLTIGLGMYNNNYCIIIHNYYGDAKENLFLLRIRELFILAFDQLF